MQPQSDGIDGDLVTVRWGWLVARLICLAPADADGSIAAIGVNAIVVGHQAHSKSGSGGSKTRFTAPRERATLSFRPTILTTDHILRV
jgi:hypothetical protein